jgi:hypothetical protein
VIKAVLAPGERVGVNGMKEQHYSQTESKQALQQSQRVVKAQEREIGRLQTQVKTLKLWETRPWTERLLEASVRSNVGMMMYELALAEEKNLLEKQPAQMLVQMQSQIHNMLAKSSKGWNHEETTKTFYEVLAIKGKKQVVEFAAANLNGPSLSTVRARIRKTCPIIRFGVNEQHFEDMAAKYKVMMAAKGIDHGSVLCEHAEDETSNIKAVEFLANLGQFLGF